MMERNNTKTVLIGGTAIGGQSPVRIQSMTNTDTRNAEATAAQIHALEAAGCEIVRCAVPDMQAAEALHTIKQRIHIPLVADIHFDHRLALAAIKSGVDKLRINPGNIGSEEKIKEVVAAAKDSGVPIRIGVNAGSLEKDLLAKYGKPSAKALVESAERHIAILEKLGFSDTVVSMKASGVPVTVEACRLFSSKHDYPLHLGVTEAGLFRSSAVKSALGIGTLLMDGIGDTIRVSVTGDPVSEIGIARDILIASDRTEGHSYPEIVACPTCGRTRINLEKIASEIDQRLGGKELSLKIAVMGCIVNGPGEGREADIGVAGGDGKGVLFKKGEIFKTVPEDEIVDALVYEAEKMKNEL